MRLEYALAALIAVGAFAVPESSFAEGGSQVVFSTRFSSTITDPFGGDFYKVNKSVSVRFCQDMVTMSDDDDGTVADNDCSVCPSGQFEYVYRIKNSSMSTLGIEQFRIPVPSTDVADAGSFPGATTPGIPPSAITVGTNAVVWDFIGASLIAPATRSEKLYICTNTLGPGTATAGISGQFAIDAEGECLTPSVLCTVNREDDDDGAGDDDDGVANNYGDGAFFSLTCPAGPFANVGTTGDDDDD